MLRAATTKMMATTTRRAVPGISNATRIMRLQQQQQQRLFSSEPTIKRPRAIKVKKSDARRRVEPKPEAEPPQHDALVEAPQQQAPPPSTFLEQQRYEPATFGQVLKSNFILGVGVALGFALVGTIASFMEEETLEPGKYDASDVIIADAHE